MKIYLFCFSTIMPESGVFLESRKVQYFLSGYRLLIGTPMQLIFFIEF